MKITLTQMLLLTIVLLSISRNGIAQEDLKFDKFPLKVSYYGDNLFHPGLSIGTQIVLADKVKSKIHLFSSLQTNHGNKRKHIEYLLEGSIGGFSHPNNFNGYVASLGLTRMRTKLRNNRRLGWSFDINFLLKSSKLSTFVLEGNNIEEITKAKDTSFFYGIGPSFGRGFNQGNKGITWAYFVKPTLQILKYNHGWFPNSNLELGILFNLKNVMK